MDIPEIGRKVAKGRSLKYVRYKINFRFWDVELGRLESVVTVELSLLAALNREPPKKKRGEVRLKKWLPTSRI